MAAAAGGCVVAALSAFDLAQATAEIAQAVGEGRRYLGYNPKFVYQLALQLAGLRVYG